MKKVNHYEVEVKYSGKVTDYTVKQLYKMALAAQDRRGDYTPTYVLTLSDRDARKIDGMKGVLVDFPDNHLCIFAYAYIEEQEVEVDG